MGEVTAPAGGPLGADGSADAAGAGTEVAWVTWTGADIATPDWRETRMRAPFCSISISVRPVSVRSSARSRIAAESIMPCCFGFWPVAMRAPSDFTSFMFMGWNLLPEGPWHRRRRDSLVRRDQGSLPLQRR